VDHAHGVYKALKRLPPFGTSVGVGAVIFAGLFGYAYLRISELTTEVGHLTQELASTTEKLSERTDQLAAGVLALDQKALGLSNTLSAAERKIEATRSNVDAVKSQVGGVAQAVGSISGTVTTLEKLSKTDPELLQKYSRVFFLNEHYAPERISEIEKQYLYSEDSPETIHALVWPYLKALIDSAQSANTKLYIKSAYRSFDEQKSLKSAYQVVYGAGAANQFSADQGYSEHQLGTTVDFITTGLGGGLEGFDRTQAYQWLLANAHLYGFTLSYPSNNAYYIFEPWHWRFVGVKLATFLKEQNKHFYDLEQREIDEYLTEIF